MHKARKVLFALGVAALILACSLAGTPVTPGDGVSTIVASTIAALSPVAPASTATNTAPVAGGIPVSYKNVSFTIPSGLAADAAPQTVPLATDQTGAPWDAAPEHIEFRLDGYNVPANSFSVAQIDVYPARAYADANAGANIGLQRLQGVLGNPSAALTNQSLPQVPFFNAASMLVAQTARIHFQDGDGVRSLTQYGQAVGPVSNNGLFYHFQGLTSDGSYYIVVILPVQAAFLQNGNDPGAGLPADGIPFPGYDNGGSNPAYEAYFTAVAARLDSTPADAFKPSLAALDALVQSFSVQP